MQDLPLEHLEHQLTEYSAHLAAGMCRWLELVAEFERREAWRAWDCRSCAHWLSWRCSIEPVTAREQVRVACRLGELPEVREAFATGEMSYSKVRAITRVATPATESVLLELARHSTAAQLEKLVRAYRGMEAAELAAANAADARRFLRWQWNDDGTLSVQGRLPAEDGAAFIAAIEGEALVQLRAERVERGASAEAPVVLGGVGGLDDADAALEAEQAHRVGRGARAADAMMRLIDAARAADRPASRAGLTEVVVHVDGATLAGDADIVDRCEIEDGPVIPPETARRLCCDGAVVVMSERDGQPLDVGRRTRKVPVPLRRALQSRDGGCRFPGCDIRASVDAHHIVHWVRGGPTDRDNLVLLCRFHHRLVHEGGYAIQGRPPDLRFLRLDGSSVEAVPPPVRGRADQVAGDNAAAGLVIDEHTSVPRWWGDPLHLGRAVDAIVQAEERRAA